MRRAIVFATLIVLLFAVAGVTVAREDTSGTQAGGPTESTAPGSAGPELTAPEATSPETTAPETTVRDDADEPSERTAASPDPAPEQPREHEKETTGVRNYGGNQGNNRIERAGEPVHAQAGRGGGIPGPKGKPERPVKPPVEKKPDDGGEVGEERAGGNPGKVIICHKGRVTISVGAPARPAHLRHGDSLGPC